MFNLCRKLIILLGLLLSTQVIASDLQSSQQCLAENIYFEARNQGAAGWLAITAVTFNRVESRHFPDTICEVVFQGPTHLNSDMPVKHKCQFSWYCDGKSDYIANLDLFFKILYFSKLMVNSNKIIFDMTASTFGYFDITDGSTHYHHHSIKPFWARSMTRTVRIDDHIFYRED